MGKPAARVGDGVKHSLPSSLTATTLGSPNVRIGGQPAWRGLPATSAAVVKAAKKVADEIVDVAEKVTKNAAPPPAKVVAYAAEQATKSAVFASMSSLITTTAAAASAGSTGVVDLHFCTTPSPVPPHGPGVVVDGSNTVFINGLPACFQGNPVIEPLGSANKITGGCSSVRIGTGSASPISVDVSSFTTSMRSQVDQSAQEAKDKQQQALKENTESQG